MVDADFAYLVQKEIIEPVLGDGCEGEAGARGDDGVSPEQGWLAHRTSAS